MNERITRLIKTAVIMVSIGIVYGIWHIKTGIGIPCPIRTITGFRCPGCGVTHMCTAVMQGRLPEAYQANRVLFCLLPALVAAGIHFTARYIKYGSKPLSKWENGLLYCLIGIFIIWGVLRNIPAFSYLN
ncbi:MAG: DUF2752 domain-containing protein [bacterium]|nr:DUF2752 domain-containing protein [bacterium]